MRSICALCFVLACSAYAQRIAFVPCIGGSPIILDRPAALPDGTPVTITQFRFYAGHFAFYRAGQVISRSDDYRLIDVADTTSLLVDLDARIAHVGDSISFILGVDSLTNVSGVLGGDLDPINGMYWTWNSGYINLKLEGTSPVSPYPAHAFELHLGGYLPPHATAQRIALRVSGSGPWVVKVDVAPLLAAADIRTRCNVMSPGEKAVRSARVAATMFEQDAAR